MTPLHDRSFTSARHPPANILAEMSLLGALLSNNKIHGRISDFLAPEHFADPANSRVYQAISRRVAAGQVADCVTLRVEFEASGALRDVGGSAYLAKLLAAMVGVDIAVDYAKSVHDAWLRRQLIDIGSSVVENAFGADPDLDVPRQIEQSIDAIEALRSELASLGVDQRKRGRTMYHEAVRAAIDRADGMTSGRVAKPATTGMAAVDRALGGGLVDATLVYLLGLGGAGKTELALQVAEEVARSRMRRWQVAVAEHDLALAGGEKGTAPGKCPGVLFFSFDMQAGQLGTRAAARLGGVPLWRLRRGELDGQSGERLINAANDADLIPIEIDDQGPATVAHIQGESIRFCANRPCAAIFIDNASNIATETDPKGEHTMGTYVHMTNRFKALAKMLNVPVILLMHLNKGIADRVDPTPRYGDIPYGMQKDADFAVAVHRPALALSKKPPPRPAKLTEKGEQLYLKQKQDWHDQCEKLKHVTELVPMKMREDDDGGGGEIARLVFDIATRRFSDVQPEVPVAVIGSMDEGAA